MRSISIHVDDADYQVFKTLAARRSQPIAALFREAMAAYLKHEHRTGSSILDLPAHASGEMLSGWERSELYDEMLDRENQG